jgi:hypothetical protein
MQQIPNPDFHVPPYTVQRVGNGDIFNDELWYFDANNIGVKLSKIIETYEPKNKEKYISLSNVVWFYHNDCCIGETDSYKGCWGKLAVK